MAGQDTRDILIEMAGSVQLQACMFHSPLEFLDKQGLLTPAASDAIFEPATCHIGRAADAPARRFALQILDEWRAEGLVRGDTRG